MSNVYAPPEAELNDVVAVSGESPKCFAVSEKKFWIMSVGTLGLYDVYWFYKHWTIYKEQSGEKLRPFWRTVFSIFFVHRLFGTFTAQQKEADTAIKGAATGYVLITIASQILSRMSNKEIGSPWTDLLVLAVIPFGTWLLIKGQRVANEVAGSQAVQQNSALTAANWVWLVLGGLLWLLSFVGVASYFVDLGI